MKLAALYEERNKFMDELHEVEIRRMQLDEQIFNLQLKIDKFDPYGEEDPWQN